MRYDAILFDVDGTLIDSAPGILHTLEEVFHIMGTDITGVDLHKYLGPPLRKTFGEYYADENTIEHAAALYRSSYAVKGSHDCKVYPGARKMLHKLKTAGVVLCTATCKPTEVVRPILEEQGLAPFFDIIIGASMDTSRDTKTDVISYAMNQPMLGGHHVLMVGDRSDDILGARACGVDAAAVLYGYGSLEELVPFSPLLYAENCDQLTDFILSSSAK